MPWSKFPGRRINIWHFSDVRDLGEGPREPVGGAARMASAIHHAEAALGSAPLVLFSGGALGPSDAVVLARGEHAISALNAMQVQCAVVGNRDLAFGLERFEELSRLSAFPWLLSNARLAKGGGPVPGTERSRIIEHLGVRVGLIGLVDGHWAAPAGADDAVLECLDAVEEARVLASQLRQDGAEIVVALTHARAAVDRALCSQVPEVDLVLGGHDGSYEASGGVQRERRASAQRRGTVGEITAPVVPAGSAGAAPHDVDGQVGESAADGVAAGRVGAAAGPARAH